MYEILLNNAKKYNADISHCGYQMIFEDGRVNYFHNTGCLVQQDRTTGLKDLLDGSLVEPGLWNKLFHKNLFHSLLHSTVMNEKLERVMGKGGTNKFLYIESVLQKYAGLKMFTKLPLRAKEKLKKRIIKIVEVVPDYKELILASFFKSDKKKIVLLDPSYDGDNTGDQIIVENCKKYFPLTKKENIIYVPTHRKLMNKEIRELSGATIKVLCGTNALSGHMRTYGLWRMEKKVRIYNNTILMGVGFECNNQEYDYYTKMLLHTILHKKYIHSVRDSFSEQMLNSMGITNVINTGCPTMWGITKELCQDIPKRKAQEVICTLTDYDRDLENDQKLLDILLLCYKKIYLWPQGIEDEEYYKELRIDSKIVKIPFGLENYDSLLEHKEIDYVGTRLHAGIRAIGKRHRTIIS